MRIALALTIFAAPAFADGPGHPVPDTAISGLPVETCGILYDPATNSWRTVLPCERQRDEGEGRNRFPGDFPRPTPDIPGGGDPDTPPKEPPHVPPGHDKPKDNSGLGNGDEGDCRGRGCGDADNPAHGDDQ